LTTPYAEEQIPESLQHLLSDKAQTGETMVINMGPQHPSTHGVLRLILELDGEEIVNCIPDIGFLHTGIEKNMEAKTYEKALVMTDRTDYLNNLGNNLTYCLAVEKLVQLDVPPRAQAIRVMMVELQRIASHLVWLGTHALDLAAHRIDLALRATTEALPDMGYRASTLADFRIALFASPDYLAKAGTPMHPRDLLNHNCLHYTYLPVRDEWQFVGPEGRFSVPVRGNLQSTDDSV
jgi:hypothetical protein